MPIAEGVRAGTIVAALRGAGATHVVIVPDTNQKTVLDLLDEQVDQAPTLGGVALALLAQAIGCGRVGGGRHQWCGWSSRIKVPSPTRVALRMKTGEKASSPSSPSASSERTFDSA